MPNNFQMENKYIELNESSYNLDLISYCPIFYHKTDRKLTLPLFLTIKFFF